MFRDPTVLGIATDTPFKSRAIANSVQQVDSANAITGGGETTWFESVMLIGVYVVLGLAFFFA